MAPSRIRLRRRDRARVQNGRQWKWAALRHFGFAVRVLLRVALPVQLLQTLDNPWTALVRELLQCLD